MASAEHCLLCFEAVEAHLEDRKCLSLERVQSLWAAYSSSAPGPSSSPAGAAALKDPALLRVAASDNDGSSSVSSSCSSVSASPALAATPATSTSSLPLAPTSTPLFVTWNTVSDGDTSLRGCIGTFEAQPLAMGIPEYAVISAVQDSRFHPVSKRELPELQVAVTLLTDFEEVQDPHDWEIGTHGIRLSFHDRGRRYGSTYLPDVASEQGWTKDETLFSLIRKAGWVGSRSRWKDLDLKVTRYRGKKCSMEYPDYKKWKEWVKASRQ
ncbi:hypothetical protein HIM_03492 [Hirsutella minnesotensis 3608]|uniref:AMMECR1 domain-containing protein n=1 Tax=Hirsutella minnesotensis 3608 TaxID=1043627 RepID=A0A0F7ZME5_9HYPO|nr:hypothetical protein HIM_03492 [Hirsutella minnesotensis 3608]